MFKFLTLDFHHLQSIHTEVSRPMTPQSLWGWICLRRPIVAHPCIFQTDPNLFLTYPKIKRDPTQIFIIISREYFVFIFQSGPVVWLLASASNRVDQYAWCWCHQSKCRPLLPQAAWISRELLTTFPLQFVPQFQPIQ